jgi:hypothetical protein
VSQKLAAGEVFDVVVQSASAMDDYAKLGGLKSGTRVKVARVGIGMAVAPQATPPDIATPAAFKTALLNAKSIAVGGSCDTQHQRRPCSSYPAEFWRDGRHQAEAPGRRS